MKIGLFFLVAFENMIQHKLRTFLTLLGLIVGMSSVLLMTGLGRGFAQVNRENMSDLLPNKLTLRQGFNPDGPTTPLTLRDATLLAKTASASTITAVAPVKELYDVPVKGLDVQQGQGVSVIATTPDYALTENLTPIQGRFFTTDEAATQQLVAVVNTGFIQAMAGGNIAGNNSAAPSALYLGNNRFQIVGVIEGQQFWGDFPQVLIPLPLLRRYVESQSIEWRGRDPVVDHIYLLAADIEQIEETKQQVEVLIRLAHGLSPAQPNDFSLDQDNQFLDFVEDFNRTFTLVLGGIGTISLIVGGIGIMNIMLATITERTREIGIRKAIGATNGDILAQFLVEAIFICLSGALLAVTLSYAISLLVDLLLQNTEMRDLSLIIDLQSIFIAAGCGVVSGILFGLYPALRAMRLDPIDALRTE